MAERIGRRPFLGGGLAAFSVILLGREFSGTLVLAHGYNASPSASIYQALGTAVPAEFNYQTVIPDLPLSNRDTAARAEKIMDPETASSKIAGILESARRPLILAGHSLGVNITLYTLSHYDVSVDAALLIAGRFKTPSGDENLERCYRRQLNPTAVRERITGPFLAVSSRDDGVVKPPEVNLDNLAKTFGAMPVLTQGYGHFDQPEHLPFLMGIMRQSIVPVLRQGRLS